MKNNKMVPIILVGISCFLFIVAIILLLNANHFTLKHNLGYQENTENQVKEENENNQQENSSMIQEELNSNESLFIEENDAENTSEHINDNTSNSKENQETQNYVIEEANSATETIKDENEVIRYFTLEDEKISTFHEEDSSLREKAKNTFTTIIDFIFYNKEVKGYTFKELTTTAKLKVIQLALSIDSKIDQYFPNYKDIIKDKYSSLKGKLAVMYLEFTSSLCETVGIDTCNQAKEDFNTMKESFGFTWDLIKELASSGSSKVKEFYESWRDSE